MYKLIKNLYTNENHLQRLIDGAFIPTDPSNRDYQEYLEWINMGNQPETEE